MLPMTDDQPSYTARIGDRMRRRRWHRMWNISDVLERLEPPVDEATYTRWEDGTEPIPVNMPPPIHKALELTKVGKILPFEG